MFRPGPADGVYKNFVTNFARNLAADPAAPRLSMGRARSSFICGHLAAGTPLGELLASSGIWEAESLARYARHVGGAPPKAVLRAWDKTPAGTRMNGRGLETQPGTLLDDEAVAFAAQPTTAPARPRSSRPRSRTPPAGLARCRCAPCSPPCCAWP